MSQLADGWRWRSIDELTGGVRGNAVIGPFGSDLKVSDYTPDGVRLVFVRDIRTADFTTDGPCITLDKAVRLRAHGVRAGDLLVTKMGDPPGDAAIYDANEDAIITADCIRLRLSSDFDPRFVAYSFGSEVLKRQVDSITRGAAQRKVSLERLRTTVRVPAPSLVEQRRIADVLDRANALRTKRRAVLAHLEGLADSIFVEMFGEPTRNERRWPASQIGDFVYGFESGKNLVADDAKDLFATHRVLKVSAVTSGRFRSQESKALPSGYVPPAHHLVKDGDLLFSRANTTELIGATALVVTPPTNLALPDKLWRFRWYAEPRADPVWVWHLFKRPAFRREVGRRATGTSGSMQNISQAKVLSIDVGLPPLADQRQFALRAEAIERATQASLAGSESLDLLFAALQHRAFAGEL